MALYRAKDPDGNWVQFDATTSADAKAIYKERYGRTPLSIGKVPAGTPLPTPSPTPTPTPTPTPAPTPQAPAPTTAPTPTSPAITAPTTTKPLTPEDWAAAQARFGLTPATEAGAEFTKEEQLSYIQYKKFRNTEEGKRFPGVATITDYLERRSEIMEKSDYYTLGYTEEQIEEITGYTAEQWREYNEWQRYASTYGELGDWRPTNLADWLANYEQAQQQLQVWQQSHQEQLAEQEAIDEYALDPAEAARRREESYRESRVAAGERYREPARLSEGFTQWMQGQSDMSGAFTGFVESKYPSLQSEFQAGLPRPTGFPTREAARAEAGRREAGWQAWLPGQVPELYQEYMMQRPYQRGERLGEYAPTLRAVNW